MSVKARSIRKIPGMGGSPSGGRVLDYRGTGLCPPNGGRIRPLLFVHHIPVVRNAKGAQDGILLGNILKNQGLSIQCATDAEGNVFLYTRFDELCYGHRGANQIAAGCEHMHYSVSEPWSRWQMRAAAWCANQMWVSYGVPPQRGIVTQGSGSVGVSRRGHTSHQNISNKAGFHDRSDPGSGFDYAGMYELTRFYNKHHRF